MKRLVQNANPGNLEGFVRLRAFELALQYACNGLLYNLAMRPDDTGPMDEFYHSAIAELGMDPNRTFDDELIAEAIPKLRERGVEFGEMVEIVLREMVAEQKYIAQVGWHH